MPSEKTIVLGIDPGNSTGFGLIENGHSVLSWGVIKPKGTFSRAQRCYALFDEICKLIEDWQPVAIAVETQYVSANAQSALQIGVMRGVALTAAGKYGMEMAEYPPAEVKKAIVGWGSASKEQVQKTVQQMFFLTELPVSDAADALAVALCHLHRFKRCGTTYAV